MNLKTKVPAAFSEKHSHRRSDSYDHISTENIMAIFQENNWLPHTASQVRNQSSTQWNAGYAKHLITFKNPDLPSINGIFPQINLINSHDGSSMFQMMAGLYRMVCSNGLIVADSEFEKIQIRHRFLNPEVISEAIKQIVDVVPDIIGKADTMQSTILSEVDRMNLGQNVIEKIWTNPDVRPFESIQLINPIRKADADPNLWNTYNTIQEHLMKGGLIGTTSTNKKRKMRGITNIDKTVKVNQLLWEEADKVLQAA